MLNAEIQETANVSGGAANLIAALNFLADVAVQVIAELDRRTITFAELVKLEPEAIVMLNRPAGENIDLYVGDALLGSGEILVIDGRLSIRVAELKDKPPAYPKATEVVANPAAA